MNWLSDALSAIGDFVMDKIVNPIVEFFSSTPPVANTPTVPPVEIPTTPSIVQTEDISKVEEIKLPEVEIDEAMEEELENEVYNPPLKESSPSKNSKIEKAKKKADMQKPEKKNNCIEEENCCKYCNKDLPEELLCSILPSSAKFLQNYTKKKFAQELNTMMKKYNITTCIRRIHFLAQVLHEVGDELRTEEIGGMAYFKKQNYRGGPFYHGRGLIQITHIETYKKYLKSANLKFTTSNCEKLKTSIKYSIDSAGWFWIKPMSGWGDIRIKSDNNDFLAITVAVNGGFNGLKDRKKRLLQLYTLFNAKQCKTMKNKSVFKYKISDSKLKNRNFWKSGLGKRKWQGKHAMGKGNTTYEI